jgi:hypothetical protein
MRPEDMMAFKAQPDRRFGDLVVVDMGGVHPLTPAVHHTTTQRAGHTRSGTRSIAPATSCSTPGLTMTGSWSAKARPSAPSNSHSNFS